MPPTGYLTAAIEASVQFIAANFPAIATLIPLHEHSVEGRAIHAVRSLAAEAPTAEVPCSSLVYMREIVNPDALVTLALKLCQAYTNGTGLSFGGKNYSAEQIALIVDALDVVMLPSLTPTAVRMCSHQPGRRCGARIERSTLASHAVVSTSIATLTFCGQVASAPAAPRAVTCSRGLRHFRNPRRATCVTFSMTIPTSGISSTFTHIRSWSSIPGAMTITRPLIRRKTSKPRIQRATWSRRRRISGVHPGL